jgi:hypothetical protein
MSSLRRIAASRANGARSGGPVTRAGKRRSSLNAVRHGLLAKCVVLDNESREGFDALLADFVARFGPVDNVELGMVEEMLSAFWRQRRAWAIETQVMGAALAQEPADHDELARLTNAFTADSVRPQLELMHRYETRLHRMFQRALSNFILLRSLPGPPAPVEPDCPSEHKPEDESLAPVGHALACPGEDNPEQESLSQQLRPPAAAPRLVPFPDTRRILNLARWSREAPC